MNPTLSATLWCVATIAVFAGSRWVFIKTKQAWLHPVLWTSVVLIAAMEVTGRDYAAYRRGTSWLIWLLGPGVVALAVPVYRLRAVMFEHARLLAVVVGTGLAFSMASTAAVLAAFSLGQAAVMALSLKSVTAAVAFAIARETGALPLLAGVGTMVSAILGAVVAPAALRLAGVTDPRAVGLTLGCTAHGVGTARAFEFGETQGVFASVGMALTALTAALVCPALFMLFSRLL